MKVKIGIEFEVEGLEEELDEEQAKCAASVAAWDYLAFVEISSYSTDTEWVEVHLDGYGKCRVRVGEEHD